MVYCDCATLNYDYETNNYVCPVCDKQFKVSAVSEIDLYNAEHPSRQKAIEIMHNIAEEIGEEDVFDCKNDGNRWYNIEDMITEIIERS